MTVKAGYGSIVVFGLALVLGAGSASPQASRRVSCAIVNVNVVPMDTPRVLADQTVLVGEGLVQAVGPASEIAVPAGVERIDARGGYLVPGLTDSHVHVTSDPELSLFLANGVTTVYNLHGNPSHLLWRKQVAEGRLTGPTIVTTGPIFMRARPPEEAVRLVDEIADAGYDGVKIYNQVSKPWSSTRRGSRPSRSRPRRRGST